jgi:tetratricopeptide (TPR) repeat protein
VASAFQKDVRRRVLAASARQWLAVEGAAETGADWPFACLAWLAAGDAGEAARVMETALRGGTAAGLPLVCQTARLVAEAGDAAARARVEALAPSLRDAFEAEIRRCDPGETGIPAWPSAAESLFPSEWTPDSGALDLAALLLNECEAVAAFETGSPSSAGILAETERGALSDWLSERRWNEEFLLFAKDDGEEGEDVAPDESPAGMYPLLWRGLPAALRESGGERAMEVAEAGGWTARGWFCFAMLAWLPDGCEGICRALARRMAVPGRLPEDGAEGVPPALQAAWVVACDGVAERTAAAAAASRRKTLVRGGAAALAAVLAFAGLAAAGMRGGAAAEGGAATPERAARRLCRDGDHAGAALVYAGMGTPGGEFRRAGELLHMGDAAGAERLYRGLLAAGEKSPSVRLNLALACQRQGRLDEAARLYRKLAEDAAETHPDAARRAERAADLLEATLGLAP